MSVLAIMITAEREIAEKESTGKETTKGIAIETLIGGIAIIASMFAAEVILMATIVMEDGMSGEETALGVAILYILMATITGEDITMAMAVTSTEGVGT